MQDDKFFHLNKRSITSSQKKWGGNSLSPISCISLHVRSALYREFTLVLSSKKQISRVFHFNCTNVIFSYYILCYWYISQLFKLFDEIRSENRWTFSAKCTNTVVLIFICFRAPLCMYVPLCTVEYVLTKVSSFI